MHLSRSSERIDRPLVILLDGVAWRPTDSRALAPLVPMVEDVSPWPAVCGCPVHAVDWLAGRTRRRPVLGLTTQRLRDDTGRPLRGAARPGGGVALVSTAGLSLRIRRGTIRHELGHAHGLDHCLNLACVMSERRWPLSADDRPGAFCPACAARWRERFGR